MTFRKNLVRRSMSLRDREHIRRDSSGPKGHPAACTCYACREAKRADQNREVAERLIEEAQGKNRHAPVRNLSPRPPGPTQTGTRASTPSEPAKRPNNSPPRPIPNLSPRPKTPDPRARHDSRCTCVNCRSSRASRAAQPAHGAERVGGSAGAKRQRLFPAGRAAKGFSIGAVIAAVGIAAFVIFLVVSLAGSSGNSSGDVQADQGGWFSFDCDSERTRRRGGWLRGIVCR